MPANDNVFSQLLSKHIDPGLSGNLEGLFSDLTREPSYLDKFSGTGPFNVRDPFVMNMFLKYLQGPMPPSMEDDPVQQLHSFIHPDVYRPQTRPENAMAPKTKQKRLSPYSQDIEEFKSTPDTMSQIDRMPLTMLHRLLMRL